MTEVLVNYGEVIFMIGLGTYFGAFVGCMLFYKKL